MSSKVYKNVKGVNCVFSCFGGLIKPKYEYVNNECIIYNDKIKDNILENIEFLDFLENFKKQFKNKCLYICPCCKEYTDEKVLKHHFGDDVKKDVVHLESFSENIVYFVMNTAEYLNLKGKSFYSLKNNCIYWWNFKIILFYEQCAWKIKQDVKIDYLYYLFILWFYKKF